MLRELSRTRGRAVKVSLDGTLHACRGYELIVSRDHGATWRTAGRLPCKLSRRLAGRVRPAARLLRHEVRALGVLSGGDLVAASREGVYYSVAGEPEFRASTIEAGGQRPFPPMTMTVGPGDRVLWGEYDSRTAHGKPVRLYVSNDRGRSYRIARVFEGGSILHIHNLVFDASLKKYWVLAGDHNHEPGIGLLDEDLSGFDWLVKGEQKYRAVEVFDFGDRLVYGIDSEKERNAIVTLDKRSGRVERLVELEGSVIYAARFGRWYAMSTTVEPSAVNPSRTAALWVSNNGVDWTRAHSAEKDAWDARYFQYGSIVLPRGESNDDTIVFSGQALRGIDGKLMAARFEPDAK